MSTTYEVTVYEYLVGTEVPETYIVLINGKDGPVFATKGEAEAWVAAQN